MTIRLKNVFLLFLGAFSLLSCKNEENTIVENLSQYVEPRIGTAYCRWFHFAPGAMPFGMAKPAPSTNGSLGNKSGWEATGYDYRNNTIEGFPCLHEFQIGGISLMPTVGELLTVPGLPSDTIKTGYRSRFSHENEVVEPGYYSVLLEDYQIQAELTATERCGIQRYTFPKAEAVIFLNLSKAMNWDATQDSHIEAIDSVTIRGYRYSDGWALTEDLFLYPFLTSVQCNDN